MNFKQRVVSKYCINANHNLEAQIKWFFDIIKEAHKESYDPDVPEPAIVGNASIDYCVKCRPSLWEANS